MSCREHRRLGSVALLLSIGLPASVVSGQVPDPASEQLPTTAEQDSIQLVFDREVFTYPSFERRNPFRSLTGEEGPRFEDMVLLGVVLSSRAGSSIAVVGARPPGSTSDQEPTRLFRLRSGESVGNVRVLEIRRREVVFSVDDFGIVETRMLELPQTLPPVAPLPEVPADQPPAEDGGNNPVGAVANPSSLPNPDERASSAPSPEGANVKGVRS